MQMNTERENETLIVKAEGRIDGTNAHEFEDALKAAISDDDRAVIIDFDSLSYISSAGLRIILVTAKALWKRDVKLMLCSLSGPIREIFEISGFDQIIPLHDTRTKALAEIDG